MQAIILAAGSGTRLHPFTKNKPKALINLAGVPLIEFTFNQLLKTKANISEFILVVNYMQEKIKKYFGDSYNKIPIRYVKQDKKLGTGHALLMVEEFIKEDFLMLYGDDLYSFKDIQKVLENKNCMLLQKLEDVSNFGVVSVDGKGKVIDVIEKPTEAVDSNLINIGVFHFSKEIFGFLHKVELSSRSEYELTDAVKMLAEENKMHYTIATEFWKPVGYPWHILSATQTILEHRTDELMVHKGTVKAGAMVEPEASIDTGSVVEKGARIMGLVVIGRDVKIGENVTIVGPSVISSGTIIGKGSVVERSVIGVRGRIGDNCHIHNSVIGDDATVKDSIKTEYNSPEKTILVDVKGKKVDTGLTQLGAFVAKGAVVSRSTVPGEVVE